MQIPGFAIEAQAVPIEDAVSRVAVLLDFDDKVSFADGVEASARNKDAVALPGGEHVEAFFNFAAPEFFLEGRARRSGRQTGIDAAARGALQEIPHLGLRFPLELRRDRGGWVNLDRKAVARIEQFAKQGEAGP